MQKSRDYIGESGRLMWRKGEGGGSFAGVTMKDVPMIGLL